MPSAEPDKNVTIFPKLIGLQTEMLKVAQNKTDVFEI